ncbi:hypothetical protein ACHAXS_004724 [Conticribra weissflogii]
MMPVADQNDVIDPTRNPLIIKVDVIIAVHNAELTIQETVKSAMYQEVPAHLFARKINLTEGNEANLINKNGIGYTHELSMIDLQFDVCVCCYNDASTDKSLVILHSLQNEYNHVEEPPTNVQNVCYGDDSSKSVIKTTLLVGTSKEGISSRGAGYARNEAVKLRREHERNQRQLKTNNSNNFEQENERYHFLCILDSDDVMHPTRVAEQTFAMLSLGYKNNLHLCENTLMGCQFDRIPHDSTRHYSKWANTLSDERLYLEQFRECTLIQPTWFLSAKWFERLGGYVEAPIAAGPSSGLDSQNPAKKAKSEVERDFGVTALCNDDHSTSLDDSSVDKVVTNRERSISFKKRSGCSDQRSAISQQCADFSIYKLIHPSELKIFGEDEANQNKKRSPENQNDQPSSLRLAEDLRLFYAHLYSGGKLCLHRTSTPLVSYRHRCGMSQSSNTPRKLLLKLRAKAWEDLVFHKKGSKSIWKEQGFAIWGAGRDGKDFLKALSPEVASRVVCFVDVDLKKIEQIKFYFNPSMGRSIPIYHFSRLGKDAMKPEAGNPKVTLFGRIDKSCYSNNLFGVKNEVDQRKQHGEQLNATYTEHSSNVKNVQKESTNNVYNIDSVEDEFLKKLPVVVCVAMYRTNGALESNVKSIGRIEGNDLWHIF